MASMLIFSKQRELPHYQTLLVMAWTLLLRDIIYLCVIITSPGKLGEVSTCEHLNNIGSDHLLTRQPTVHFHKDYNTFTYLRLCFWKEVSWTAILTKAFAFLFYSFGWWVTEGHELVQKRCKGHVQNKCVNKHMLMRLYDNLDGFAKRVHSAFHLLFPTA